MKGFYKTTIVIWSDFDPADYDIEDLSREALKEDAHLSVHKIEFIGAPEEDADWDGSDFFNSKDDEDG